MHDMFAHLSMSSYIDYVYIYIDNSKGMHPKKKIQGGNHLNFCLQNVTLDKNQAGVLSDFEDSRLGQ